MISIIHCSFHRLTPVSVSYCNQLIRTQELQSQVSSPAHREYFSELTSKLLFLGFGYCVLPGRVLANATKWSPSPYNDLAVTDIQQYRTCDRLYNLLLTAPVRFFGQRDRICWSSSCCSVDIGVSERSPMFILQLCRCDCGSSASVFQIQSPDLFQSANDTLGSAIQYSELGAGGEL